MSSTDQPRPLTWEEKVKIILLVTWVFLRDFIVGIPKGLWHIFRCELLGRDWRWEPREVTIRGDSVGEFDHCSECGASRPHPGGL